jgi:hypothetical protein
MVEIKIESLVKYKKGKLIVVSFDIMILGLFHVIFNNTYFYVEHKVKSWILM